MDVQTLASQLAEIPMLSSLETSRRKLLAFTCEVFSYTDGDIVCNQGDASDAVFVILEGQAEVLDVSGDQEVVLALAGVNELIGELAVLRGEHRSATVRARGEVEVLRIPNDRFLDLIVEDPQVVLSVLKEISGRLVELNKRVVDLESQVR